MRSAVSSSDDGSSTGTAFLTGFSLRQIFDPDTPAHIPGGGFSWKTLLLCDIDYRELICPGFIVYSSTVVSPGLRRGATGIQPWHNRQLPGHHRG